MAACTKIAAFGALLRLFYVAFGSAQRDWTPMIWIIAILTMAVGSLFALTQTDIKRMLAYSSIAHAGFLLVGFVGLQQAGPGRGISSLQSVLFYLVTYGFMTVGAFGVVTLVRDAGGEANHLSRWAGLGKESPLVAGVFAFFLLAMAGIPLTSGFTGKWVVFTAAAQGGAWPLVVVAVLLSVVAAFFYLRVIVLMYFSDPVGDGPTVAVPSILTPWPSPSGWRRPWSLGIMPGPCSTSPRTQGPSSGDRDLRLLPGAARPGQRPRGAAAGPARRGRGRGSSARSSPRRRSSPRPAATCCTPAASGSARCWCCSRPRPATPTPTA